MHKFAQRNNELTSLNNTMFIGILEIQILSEGLIALIFFPEKKKNYQDIS